MTSAGSTAIAVRRTRRFVSEKPAAGSPPESRRPGRASAARKRAASRDAAFKRRRNRPNNAPAISHPLNALLGKSPPRAGYGARIGGKWHNATEIGQGRTALGRAAPGPANRRRRCRRGTVALWIGVDSPAAPDPAL